MKHDDLETRVTMIEQLRGAPDDKVWREFYDRYASVILSFVCKQGFGLDIAHDVLQETMVILMRELPSFTYDRSKGRFRNYVFTIAKNRLRAERRRKLRSGEVPLEEADHEDALAPLEQLEDPAAIPPAEEMDRCWRRSLWEKALHEVMESSRYQERAKKVFQDYVLEDMSAEDVAAKHEMTVNNVYQIKNRILAGLADEIRRLSPDGELGE